MLAPIIKSVNSEDNKVVLQMHVCDELECFEGHFPDYPVLPGVLQIKWVVDFANTYFPVGNNFQRIEALKFNNVIKPNSDIQLTLEYKKNLGKVVFNYQSEECMHSSGRIVLG